MLNLRVENVQVEAVGPEHGVVPGLKFRIWLSSEDTTLKGLVHVIQAELSSFGGFVAQSLPEYGSEDVHKGSHREFKLFFPMPRYVISGIESKRANDIKFLMQIRGIITELIGDKPTPRTSHLWSSYEWNLSQMEWADILRKLGYSDYWIYEVQRPKIEGWGTIGEQLDKAATALDGNNYEDILTCCRAAWSAIEPLIKGNIESIKTEIDRGSEGEEGYPDKSSRIISLKQAVASWSQVGVHRESYTVTRSDAFLCYHVTLSLMTYLSEIASKTEKKQNG